MAPPSLNPPTPGMGQPQHSLSNMGSPFAQNPAQQTSPFMGNTSSNNASNSPFEGAGFKNPFGDSNSGNPFGGGGAAGGGTKGLIESNNKLIQAINKLTGIFEKLAQKMGGGMGGAGGMMGFGGMGGGAGGMSMTDPLQQAQMRRLASGGMGNPFARQSAYQAASQQENDVLNNFASHSYNNAGGAMRGHPDFAQPFTSEGQINDYQTARGEQIHMAREAFEAGRRGDRLDFTDPAFSTYGQGGGGGRAGGAVHTPQQVEYLNQAYDMGSQQAEIDAAHDARIAAERTFGGRARAINQGFGRLTNNAFGRALGQAPSGAFNLAVNVGAAQDVTGMLSQIPFVGGVMAAPYVALQNRINQSAPLESLARLVAQQGGTGQAGNLYSTHFGLFNDFQALGLDPGAALNEALQFQEASGRLKADPLAIMGKRLGQYTGAGFTGATMGSMMRLNRADKMIQFDPSSVFGYGLSLGLGDQGMMELQGAFEGLQNMVPGMGLRGNAGVLMGQVGRNVAGGFSGTQAVLQTQRQVQATNEYGGGLRGIFGGLAETLTTASFLAEYGDPVAAIRAFESGYAANPAALKNRLTKQFGSVAEMAGLSKMTSADYDNIGSAGLPEGTFPAVDARDIVLSKGIIESQRNRGDDLYRNQISNAEMFRELNDKLEQALVNGVNVTDMEDLIQALIDLSVVTRALTSHIVPVFNFLIRLITLNFP